MQHMTILEQLKTYCCIVSKFANILISFLQGYLGACGALLKSMNSMEADKDLVNFGTINGS